MKRCYEVANFSAFPSTLAPLGRVQRALYADEVSSAVLVALYWAIEIQVASYRTSPCDSALYFVARGRSIPKHPVHDPILKFLWVLFSATRGPLEDES